MSRPVCEVVMAGDGVRGAVVMARVTALLEPLIEVRCREFSATPAEPARKRAADLRRVGLGFIGEHGDAGALLTMLRPLLWPVALVTSSPARAIVGDALVPDGHAAFDIADEAGLARWIAAAALGVASPSNADAARFRAIFDGALDGIFVVDGASGHILSANPAAEMLLGYPAGKLIGFPFRLLFSSADSTDSTVTLMTKLQERGVAFRAEEFRRLDGKTVELDLTARFIQWDAREAMLVELRDSAELNAAHGERDRYRAAFEECAQAMIIIDEADRVQFANGGFQDMTGYPRDLVMGQDIRKMIRGGVEDAVVEDILATIRNARVWRGIVAVRHRSGTVGRYRITAGPVRDDRGRPRGGFLAGEDVTEETLLVEGYREAQKQEALGRLATAVAHDFNNILTVLLGTASMAIESAETIDVVSVEDEEERDSVIESLRAIIDSGDRAAELTRQLLAFSAPSPKSQQPVDMNDLVASVERFVRRVLGDSISLTVRGRTGECVVMGDRTQLNQVITNLAVNARDAMPTGGALAIELSAEEFAEPPQGVTLPPGRYVRIAVKDTGIGIPDALQSRIFDPYFTTRERRGGHGMGLAIVRQIVEQHGGAMTVASRVDVGSCFAVWLPRTTHQPIRSRADDTPMPTPVAVNARLLLVEDDANLRQLMARALRGMKYVVDEMYDGVHALETMGDSLDEVDLVVLDYSMPRMNGAELADHLRERRPGLPIVFICGYGTHDLPSRWQQAARTISLPKPFTPVRLAACIRRLLETSMKLVG